MPLRPPAGDCTPSAVADMNDANGPELPAAIRADHLMARRTPPLVTPKHWSACCNFEHIAACNAVLPQLLKVVIVPFPCGCQQDGKPYTMA